MRHSPIWLIRRLVPCSMTVCDSANFFFFSRALVLGVGKSSTTNASTTKKKETVSQKFRANLNSIVHTLSLTERNFVRCISPNKHKQQDLFEEEKVLHQLRRYETAHAIEYRL